MDDRKRTDIAKFGNDLTGNDQTVYCSNRFQSAL